MTENLVQINPTKTKTVKILVYNPTNKNIYQKTLNGQLEQFSAIIPLKIKPIEVL